MKSLSAVPAVLLSIVALGACGAATAQTSSPPAPAPAPVVVRADTAPHRWTEADARFMRGMIAHHAQALEMTALVPQRTTRADLRLMAQRIALSQQDEIAMMRRWLQDRGLEAPPADAHAGHDMPGMQHALMPGMLTPEEMARLAASTGAEFETRFLEGMIRHHEGALRMVEELFASQGAAQESETYRFASDVDADQRAEIARMQTLLAATSPAAPRPR
ncbi:MAG TPA: DUF305 domain-containing protein [Longimicrobium sp.]